MGQLVDRDEEHLRQLILAHYAMAGYIAFFALFGLVYVGLGAMMASSAFPQQANSQGDPRSIGWFFAVLGAVFVVAGLLMAFLTFMVGRNLKYRRHRTFCLVVAGLGCLHIPWGTALGICTFMVLDRSSVKSLFEPPQLPPSIEPGVP